MREAVDYLKTVPGADESKFVGLQAIGEVVQAGTLRLIPRPLLHLSEIRGKTPVEVWQMFNDDVDDQRKGLIRRCLPTAPADWDAILDQM